MCGTARLARWHHAPLSRPLALIYPISHTTPPSPIQYVSNAEIKITSLNPPHSLTIVSILDQRRRRWSRMETLVSRRVVFDLYLINLATIWLSDIIPWRRLPITRSPACVRPNCILGALLLPQSWAWCNITPCWLLHCLDAVLVQIYTNSWMLNFSTNKWETGLCKTKPGPNFSRLWQRKNHCACSNITITSHTYTDVIHIYLTSWIAQIEHGLSILHLQF